MLCKNIRMIESVAKDSGLRTIPRRMRKRKGKRVEDYSLIAITQTAASQGLPEYKVENSTDIDGLIHAGHGIHSPMVPAVLRQLT